MTILPDFPCKNCHYDPCHNEISLNMDYIFELLLTESIYHVNNVPDIPQLIFFEMNQVEKYMYCTVSKILAQFYQKYPEELNITFYNVNDLSYIFPVLKQKLYNRMNFGELPSLRRLLLKAGILSMPYQCFVLEGLIIAGKFAVKCMNKFKNNDAIIFNTILYTLLDFFKETNIITWICHTSQVTHPFGPNVYLKQTEMKQNVNELCDQLDKIL